MFRKSQPRVVISFLFSVAFTMLMSAAAAHGQAVFFSTLSLTQNLSGDYSSGKYSIPEGKRLTIEQIFIEVTVPVGAKPRGYLRIDTTTGTSLFSQYLPIQFAEQGNQGTWGTVFSSVQPMKVHVTNPDNSGQTKKVYFYLEVYDGNWLTSSNMYISGYLYTAT